MTKYAINIRLFRNKFKRRGFPETKCYCRNVSTWIAPSGDQTDFFLHNLITKSLVPFVTKEKEVISWYACGPTVYDFAHVGHACSYLRLDIIRRILEKYTNKKVIQVMCVTDIDDKIICRAAELQMNWKVLASLYEKEFFSDMDSLNIQRPSIICRASDAVPQMIAFVQRLLNKNVAYKTHDGSVYFNIKNFGKHGKLRPSASQSGIVNQQDNMNKESLADFALWKSQKPNEPFWRAPWSNGRPGWHLECSTIASEYFGNSVDIHSGGRDLQFPHHENEESQCCAFHNVDQWVNYWLHTGHVIFKNEKMSKSVGNVISIKEYLTTSSPAHLRMFCLSTYYKSDVEITGEEQKTSIKLCSKFLQFFDDCQAYLKGYFEKGDIDDVKLLQILEETKKNVDGSLKNDFNTKECVTHLLQLISATYSMFQAKPGRRNPVTIYRVYSYIKNMLDIFGFEFTYENKSEIVEKEYIRKLDNVVDTCVTFRSSVRNELLTMKKDRNVSTEVLGDRLLKICDSFREELSQYGIIVKDRKNDVSTWNRIKSVKKKKNSP